VSGRELWECPSCGVSSFPQLWGTADSERHRLVVMTWGPDVRFCPECGRPHSPRTDGPLVVHRVSELP
jgi:hypothetical protein